MQLPNDDFSLLLTLAPEHPLSDVGLDSNLTYTMSSEALPAIFRLSCKVQECKSLPNSDAYHIHVVYRSVSDIALPDPWGTVGPESRISRYASATPENNFKAKDGQAYAELWMGSGQSLCLCEQAAY